MRGFTTCVLLLLVRCSGAEPDVLKTLPSSQDAGAAAREVPSPPTDAGLINDPPTLDASIVVEKPDTGPPATADSGPAGPPDARAADPLDASPDAPTEASVILTPDADAGPAPACWADRAVNWCPGDATGYSCTGGGNPMTASLFCGAASGDAGGELHFCCATP